MPPYVALPSTDHSVFYAYTIQIGGTEVGSFEKFSERSSRTVERIRQIYYNQGARPADMVWGGTDYTLELTHVEWYTYSLLRYLGVATPALEYMNFKINISEIKRTPQGAVSTLAFQDCVISDYTKDIDVGTARVMESMSVQCRWVTQSSS
jgi:hypothetical protein